MLMIITQMPGKNQMQKTTPLHSEKKRQHQCDFHTLSGFILSC